MVNAHTFPHIELGNILIYLEGKRPVNCKTESYIKVKQICTWMRFLYMLELSGGVKGQNIKF